MATKAGGGSPFAPPPEPEASGEGGLSKYEELKQRQDEMARMMMEKTMLEVNNAAKVWPSPRGRAALPNPRGWRWSSPPR